MTYSGPLYRSMKKTRKSIELTFDNVGKGLVIRTGAQGNGFQIAGPDSVFKDAVVRVQGKKVIVSHPEIVNPEAVRYAFTNTSEATLFTRDGLPSSSFRTDAWEVRLLPVTVAR